MIKELRQVIPLIFKVLGTNILIIAAPSNIFALVFGPSFGWQNLFEECNDLIMLDFLFAGRRLPYSDKNV